MNIRKNYDGKSEGSSGHHRLEYALISCLVLLAGFIGLQGFECVFANLPNYLLGKWTDAPQP